MTVQAPLFKWDASQREVKAIESEFQQAKQSDSPRAAQLLWHLSDEGHVYHRFGWGDQRSLVERPAEAGIDVREALVRFHRERYSANLMTAVVLGQEPLDALQQMATDTLGGVANRKLPRPTFGDAGQPIGDGALPRLLHVTPIKQRRSIDLQWYLPPLQMHHRAKPCDFVSHLLGHEGAGSVLAALKEAGLADGLSAGVDTDELTSAATMICVSVDLTPHGLVHLDDVVGLVLAYLGMLSRLPGGPPEWVYAEMRELAALRFRYMEAEEEMDYTRRLAISLQQRLEPAESLSGDTLLTQWEPELVSTVLQHMTPERLVAFVFASQGADADAATPAPAAAAPPPPAAAAAAAAPPLIEPWFGTEHRAEPISAARLASWRAAYDQAEQRLKLPPRNDFIPTDFSLRHPPPLAGGAEAGSAKAPARGKAATQKAAAGKVAKAKPAEEVVEPSVTAQRRPRTPPALLRAQPNGQLWHARDEQWHAPKAVVCVDLVCAGAGSSATEIVLRTLAVEVALELLNEDSYAATVAGLSYDLARSTHGLQLQVEGYSHKLPPLLLRVVSTLAGLADAPCDAALFGRVKQRLELGLKNEPGTRAEELATYERLACLTREFVHADARREALRALTPADVQARVAALLTAPCGVEANMYVGGNLDATEAVALFDQLVAALRAPPAVPAAARAVEECVLLPEAKWAVRAVPARNADDANCAVQAYWQLGANEPKLNALMSLLEHIMYEPLFDALRTKQQLGYSVYVSARNTNQMLGLLIGVVSATATPAAIEAAVATFLLTFLDSLDSMAPEAYARNVAACATNRMVDDHNMQEEATRYFAEIEAGLYEFGRAEEEAAAIHLVTQAELARWARDTMLPATGGTARGRRLSVHVYKGALTVGPPPEGATPIDDPTAHRAALASHKPTRNPLPPLSAAV